VAGWLLVLAPTPDGELFWLSRAQEIKRASRIAEKASRREWLVEVMIDRPLNLCGKSNHACRMRVALKLLPEVVRRILFQSFLKRGWGF
jgi:hypothetical protein